MTAYSAYVFTLVTCVIWFLMGFRYFSFQQEAAAKLLIPESNRGSPIFQTTAAAVRFLGGMNAAFALLSAILLVLAVAGSTLFNSPEERGTLLLVLAAAHFSQFAFNVPVLINGERQGDVYWPVLSGPMLLIFVVDAAETIICVGAGAVQFLI